MSEEAGNRVHPSRQSAPEVVADEGEAENIENASMAKITPIITTMPSLGKQIMVPGAEKADLSNTQENPKMLFQASPDHIDDEDGRDASSTQLLGPTKLDSATLIDAKLQGPQGSRSGTILPEIDQKKLGISASKGDAEASAETRPAGQSQSSTANPNRIIRSHQDLYSAMNEGAESADILITKTTGGKTLEAVTKKSKLLNELTKHNSQGISDEKDSNSQFPSQSSASGSVFYLSAGAAENYKRKCRETHGQSYELAARFVHQAKIIPVAPDLILHAGHTVYPGQNQKILVHSITEENGKKRGKIKAIPLEADLDASKGLQIQSMSLSLYKVTARENSDPESSKTVLVHAGFREIEARSIILEFSKDGSLLAILRNGYNLQVFDITQECLQGDTLLTVIENASQSTGFKFGYQSFKQPMNQIAFTPQGKYLTVWNSSEVKIFDCGSGERIPAREISIQGSIYSKIINLSIKDNLTYQIAAQIEGLQSISLFKPQHLYQPEKATVITLDASQNISEAKVQIVDDFQRASISLSNSSGEHSTLISSPGGSEVVPYLNGFNILHTFSIEHTVYYLCASDGRHFLKSSSDSNLQIPLRKTIDEPFFTVLDIQIISSTNFKLIYLGDDGICIDSIDLSKPSHQQLLTLSDYASLATNFPLTAYQGCGQNNLPLTIFNVNQPYKLHQILPGKNQQILQIKFSSDNEHLFFICDLPGENECKYQLYSVAVGQLKGGTKRQSEDLQREEAKEENKDRMKAMRLNLILEYSFQDVLEGAFQTFQAQETPIIQGKKQVGIKIQAVIQHGDNLFKVLNEVSQSGEVSHYLAQHTKVQGKIVEISSGQILYQEQNENSHLKISSINILSDQIVDQSLLSKNQSYQNWLYDIEKQLIALVNGNRIELVQADAGRTILDVEIFNKEVTLMLCQTQTIRSGHIYIGNRVLRMRYDLIGSSATQEQIQKSFFSVFDQFFDHKESEKGHNQIAKETPLFSNSQKLVQYISKSKNQIKPKIATILPMPHQRNIDIKERVGNNSEHDETFTSNLFGTDCFVSLNLSKNFYSIISHGGIHKVDVDISNEIDQYGEIVAVSNNGQGVVFMNNEIGREPRYADFTIARMTEKGLYIAKHIDLNESLDTLLSDLGHESDEFHEQFNIDLDKINSYYESFQESPELNYAVAINDMLDFTVQISDKQDDNIREQLEKAKRGELCLMPTLSNFQQRLYEESLNDDEERIKGFLYFMERRHFNPDASTKSKLSDQKVFVKETDQADTGISGFRMNSENLILWNWGQIERIRINSPKVVFQNSEFPISGLYKINMVNCSSRNPSIIAIEITNQKDNDMIVLWNIWQKKGSGVFDVSPHSQVVTDQYGRFFIVDQKKVIMADQQCELQCFHLPDDKKEFKQQLNCRFHSSFGHKFDGDKHQWLISNSTIYTSYSYMTFLQLTRQVTNEEAIENFDVDKYNFIINQKSILSIQDIQDLDGMNSLLQAFEQVDPGFLNLISLDFVEMRENVKIYPQDLLKHSLQHGRTRFVNLYLKYLSKINEDSSLKYHDIMERLLSYNSFNIYFESLSKQTNQMEKVKTLRIRDENKLGLPISDTVVAQASVQSKYLNEIFFTREFGHQDNEWEALLGLYSDCSNIPVDVRFLRLDWILYTEEGFSFLQALQKSPKNSLFQIPSIQLIIDFIYERFKFVILRWQFPIYLMQLFLFYLGSHLNERALIKMGGANGDSSKASGGRIFISIINICLALYQLGFMFLKANKQKRNEVIEPYNLCKFVSNFLIVVTALMIIIRPSSSQNKEQYVESVRIMISIISILLWIQFIQFMTLIDQIAPLVSIMFKIISEIKVFSLIFFVVLFAYGNAFYFIGRNQLEFDQIESEDFPDYSENLIWSLNHVWNIALGQFNTPNYDSGESPSQTGILWILYLTGQLMLTLNLLNMLIAIMADIFQANYETKEQEEKRTHLHFIIDNWMMKDLCLASDAKKLNFGYKSSKQKNHKYIITAFQKHELE